MSIQVTCCQPITDGVTAEALMKATEKVIQEQMGSIDSAFLFGKEKNESGRSVELRMNLGASRLEKRGKL